MKGIAMLSDRPFGTTIPVSDLQRARHFYEQVLGLEAVREKADEQEVVYRAGGGLLAVYRSAHAGHAQHTLGSFLVEDIDTTVAQLRERGVVFEHYDLPGLKTENGIAVIGKDKAAWFKDPDGNVLAISQENAVRPAQ
jgi:catechol 2,3-dioxygenase-like lactoylglutathione lyase family enzyme